MVGGAAVTMGPPKAVLYSSASPRVELLLAAERRALRICFFVTCRSRPVLYSTCPQSEWKDGAAAAGCRAGASIEGRAGQRRAEQRNYKNPR